MCDTCPTHIPGPGDVAGAVARSQPGRRVAFWGLAMPMFLGVIVYTLGWWLVPIVLGPAVVLTAGIWAVMRVMHRHVLVAAPPSLRASLPAPRRVRALALPRNLSITRKGRQALPAPARVIEPTRVLPVRPGAVKRTS